jgi:hypothetical protein
MSNAAAETDTKTRDGPRYLRRLVRWPRGRYNGRRITGLRVTLICRYDMPVWRPYLRWNHGEPYGGWLGLQVRAEATYHCDDR